MRKTLGSLLLLSLLRAPALADEASPPSPAQGAAPQPAQPPDLGPSEPAAQPPGPPPSEIPAAPPDRPPPPPPQAAAPASQPTGQWVYTAQYGWVWMPYGTAYAHAPTDGNGEPYMYVFYPTVGWTWVVAPWLWGWGPVPHFGVYGGWRFGWYGHGWGPAWHGFRPAPYRRGFVFRGGHGWRR